MQFFFQFFKHSKEESVKNKNILKACQMPYYSLSNTLHFYLHFPLSYLLSVSSNFSPTAPVWTTQPAATAHDPACECSPSTNE
jgi:hypothetical protein